MDLKKLLMNLVRRRNVCWLVMEEAEKERVEIRVEAPKAEGKKEQTVRIALGSIMKRPESWSVFGRPARRLFRVNCGE